MAAHKNEASKGSEEMKESNWQFKEAGRRARERGRERESGELLSILLLIGGGEKGFLLDFITGYLVGFSDFQDFHPHLFGYFVSPFIFIPPARGPHRKIRLIKK